MFKRKAKLPRGLPLRKVNPDVQVMIKRLERYRSGHARINKKLEWNERGKRTKWLRLWLATLALLIGLAPLSIAGYIHVAPTSIVSQVVSQEEADFLVKLRKSGCAGQYTDLVFLGLVGIEDVVRARNYYVCFLDHMNLPS